MYVCYDIKGIQQFIFSVPKLKCVIGGSAMIYRFDHETVKKIRQRHDAEQVFAGGGRGTFRCAKQQVESLVKDLVAEAHKIGLDLRIGTSDSLSKAAHLADRLYAFGPDSLEGEPCVLSGLWPVRRCVREGPREVHPLIWERVIMSQEDGLGKWVLDKLRSKDLPSVLDDRKLVFLSNVSVEGEDSGDAEAQAGLGALGGHNRWAIVAMDGNDMGKQYLAFERSSKGNQDDEVTERWLNRMSKCLDECTCAAFVEALAKAVAEWLDISEEDPEASGKDVAERIEAATNRETQNVTLPFRPLILGGDDVLLLCHCGLAMNLARDLSEAFHRLSQEEAQKAKCDGIEHLWPATNNELTISAGIVYVNTHHPLHSAIPYAESLLASAKDRYRVTSKDSWSPTPAAVDWEIITEGLLDTLAERRNRELRFKDADLGGIEIYLTRRPYLMAEWPTDSQPPGPTLAELERIMGELRSLPASLRALLLRGLRQPWSTRVQFLASLGKRYPKLKEMLWQDEADHFGSGWIRENERQVTSVPDALALLKEQTRLVRLAKGRNEE